MAGFGECVSEIMKASGDILSKREAAELLRKFNQTTKSIPIEERIASLDVMLGDIRDNMIRRNESYVLHAKQTELLHTLRLDSSVDRVKRIVDNNVDKLPDKAAKFISDTPVKKAVETLFYGSPGQRDGLVHHFEGVRTRFNVALMGSLQEKGLLAHWHDADTLASAIDVAFDPSATAASKEAQEIGGVLRSIWKLSVSRLNKAGAYVLPSPRVLFNAKVASPAKVRAMGKEAFVEFVQGLDLDNTVLRGMEEEDIAKYWENLYDRLANGDQYRAPTGTFDGVGGLTKERYKNLASSNSLDVDVPFATSAAYKQFVDALADEPMSTLLARRVDQIGRAVGLMEAFGPVPERWLDDLLGKLAGQMSEEDKVFLLKKGGYVPAVGKAGIAKAIATAPLKLISRVYLDAHPRDAMDYMLGKTSAPVDITGARVGAAVRSWASMASLHSGVFLQLTDMPLKVAQLIKYGKDPFQSLLSPITAFAQAMPSAERQLFYTRLGIAADMMRNTLIHNTTDGSPAAARAMDWYFKLNGMAAMDRVAKQHTADFMSSNLAWAVNDPVGGANVLNLFKSYGFTDADFAKLKQAIGQVEEMEVIHPKLLEELDGALYEKYLGAMNDIINTATPTPGVREKAVSLKGTQPGTLPGEAVRIGMMFKNYPSMLMTRVYPNIYYEHGVGGTMATMVSIFAMWYLGDSLKALSQGKTPKDMSKPENVIDGMLRSGFGGIYTDFIGHDYSRNGMGLADVIGGPAVGHANDLLGLGSDALRGELTTRNTVNKLNRSLPNVFYTKTALEHTLIYGILEMSDPGSVQQSYDRLRDQTGQERLF